MSFVTCAAWRFAGKRRDDGDALEAGFNAGLVVVKPKKVATKVPYLLCSFKALAIHTASTVLYSHTSLFGGLQRSPSLSNSLLDTVASPSSVRTRLSVKLDRASVFPMWIHRRGPANTRSHRPYISGEIQVISTSEVWFLLLSPEPFGVVLCTPRMILLRLPSGAVDGSRNEVPYAR